MADDTKFTQADVDKAVKEAVDKAEEGLKSKRDELMDEVKSLRSELRKSKDIDPADLQAAEDRAEKAETALKDAQKAVKDLTARAEKAEKAVEAESGYTSKLLTENALNAALAEAGVTSAPMLKAAKAMMAGSAQVVSEGDQRIVRIGDKAAGDYIKEWAATDEGKHFVTAPNNHGGGAPGGKGGGGSGKTMTRTEYNALDQIAKAEAGAAMAKGELSLSDA